MSEYLAAFTVDATDPLHAKVTVHGEPVHDQMRAAVLEVTPGQLPHLSLHLTAAGTVTGRGVVHVFPDGDGGAVAEGEAIARFLASVDPGAVESAALARAGGQGGNITAAILAVLVEQAREMA